MYHLAITTMGSKKIWVSWEMCKNMKERHIMSMGKHGKMKNDCCV